MFGENFERFAPPAAEEPTDGPVLDASDPTATRQDKAKKGKLAAKSTGHTYQFQILESIGVPREDVKKFADPYYWLEYFPPIAVVRTVFLAVYSPPFDSYAFYRRTVTFLPV